MTSLVLLFWIAAGIVLQLATYLGIVFWRHWQGYQALQDTAADLNLPLSQATPGESVIPAAWAGWRGFRVERKVYEDAARSICSFYLVPEDGQALPPFHPGQFLTFGLDIPGDQGGNERIIRCYSLSDSPRPDCYRVSIKRVPAPAGSDLPAGRSSEFFHEQIGIGSSLQVRAPSGHFYLEHGAYPVVLIGGGIGITPMLSMLNWSLKEQPEREIWLFYGVRQGQELVMKTQLDALAAAHPKFHLRICCSNPQTDEVNGRDYHHHGRIDLALLRLELALKPYHFYICGPTPLMESLVPALDDWGVPDSHIHFEAFGPASIKRRNANATDLPIAPSEVASGDIVVNFARSGKKLAWQAGAGNLLEFAEANGISVSSGCRAGGCGTCQTTIQAGEVAYHQAPDFDPEPGSCLLCMCAPKTNLTLEA